jgi:copper chaperone CopZ
MSFLKGGHAQMLHLALGLTLGLSIVTMKVWAAEQKVTLSLGGKFCDLYQGEVESALKKVPGVMAVDFKSMKGHAIVTGDAGKVKPEQLVRATNGVKGDGWHCKAEVKK